MDTLDKWTLLIIIVLLVSTTGLILRQEPRTAATGSAASQIEEPKAYFLDPALEQQMEQARQLLQNNNLEKLEPILQDLLQGYPYEGELYLLQGDLHMRRLAPVAAMRAYRQAVDLNPDFLDKKTDLFQGKKIKVATEEAHTAIQQGLAAKPADAELRDDLKVFYYMQRKLAGSCS